MLSCLKTVLLQFENNDEINLSGIYSDDGEFKEGVKLVPNSIIVTYSESGWGGNNGLDIKTEEIPENGVKLVYNDKEIDIDQTVLNNFTKFVIEETLQINSNFEEFYVEGELSDFDDEEEIIETFSKFGLFE